jgi:hypothetical protein
MLRVNMACNCSIPMGVHIVSVPIARTAEHGRLLTVHSEEQILAIGPFLETTDTIQQSSLDVEVSRSVSIAA